MSFESARSISAWPSFFAVHFWAGEGCVAFIWASRVKFPSFSVVWMKMCTQIPSCSCHVVWFDLRPRNLVLVKICSVTFGPTIYLPNPTHLLTKKDSWNKEVIDLIFLLFCPSKVDQKGLMANPLIGSENSFNQYEALTKGGQFRKTKGETTAKNHMPVAIHPLADKNSWKPQTTQRSWVPFYWHENGEKNALLRIIFSLQKIT